MILNKNLILAENQAVTATAISQNVIQWQETGIIYGDAAQIVRNLGSGTPIPLLMQVTETFATLTSLTITVETADNAALSSGAVVLASSGAIAAASLIAGYRPTFTRWVPDATMKDFFGLRFTVGGSDATAGKITAAVATEVNS
jgi:hypothetical protein